ncbi:MAG: terminase family protein [Pyrinomonadaceae bacterium]
MKSDIRLVLPSLHGGQKEVMDVHARFNVLACGRRFGKTTLGVNLLTPVALSGFPVAWFAPTYKLLLEVWDEFERLLAPVTLKKDTQQKRIKLYGGGIVECWSLDSGTVARGRKYKRVGIDEAAMAAYLETQWQEEIRPTLADYKGDAWFFSTPKGRNFFYKLFARGMDELQKAWRSFQLPTLSNPYIDPAEIHDQKDELPSDTYEQEYLARFLENAGSVFRNILARLTKIITSPGEHVSHAKVMGGDWGQKGDFTALSVGCVECRRELELVRFNQIGWAFQRARVAELCKKWGIGFGLMETNSIGSPNLEALQSEGLPLAGFETTAQSKSPLIQSLALTLENEPFEFVDDPQGTIELESYESKRNANTNRISYSAPRGMHDDTVIARALMREAVERYANGQTEQGDPLW